MPSTKGAGAPSSFAEGANGIVNAIAAAMTAPDAGPHLPMLEALLKAVVGTIQSGGAAGSKPAGMPPGGGTNIQQLMGGGAAGPSAGPAGPQSPATSGGAMSSPSGASADDMRRMMASAQGSAS